MSIPPTSARSVPSRTCRGNCNSKAESRSNSFNFRGCHLKLNRREALGLTAAALPVAKAVDAAQQAAASSPAGSAPVKWLESVPAHACGVSWGVPWLRNTVQKNEGFHLTGSDGRLVPVQSWTLAYWPDGSVKWTGLAAVIEPVSGDSFTITPGGAGTPPTTPLQITQNAHAIEVNTGAVVCRIPHSGSSLVESIST